MQNLYQVLGVADFAPIEEIQKAFNKLYADLFASDSPLANIPKLKEVKDAFEMLSDPEKREQYDSKLQEFLETLEAEFEKAVDLLAQNKVDEAIALLKDCIRMNPREPDFYETIGLAYQLSGKLDDAVKSFQQGLQTNTKNALFHRYLGDIARKMLDDDKADTHYLEAAEGFKKIMEVDPKNLQALEQLADTYSRMKWFEESLEIYEHLLALYPYEPAYHRDVGSVLYELEMFAQAEEHLLEALRNSPDDPSALLYLGLVYFRRRLLGLAIQTLEESLRLNPNQPEAEKLVSQIKEVRREIGRTVEEIIYDASPDAVVEGTVKWYNPETGMGVLFSPEYPEVLLHFSALKLEDDEILQKGDSVRFGVVKDEIGPIAVEVERINADENSETLPGTISRFDVHLHVGMILTLTGREISFSFSELSRELADNLQTGQEVIFEVKTLVGLGDEPIEKAVNIRPRKKKTPPPPITPSENSQA